MNLDFRCLVFHSAMLLMSGCNRTWTTESVVQPHLTRLDHNQNGRVEAEEYEALRRVGPPFAQVDRDRDGSINTHELAFLLHFQDPTAFDQAEIDADLRPASFGIIRLDDNARKVSEVLISLSDSLAARGQTIPSPTHLSAAIAEGDIQGPLTQATLRDLRAGFDRVGLAWPTSIPLADPPPNVPSTADPGLSP